jgi:hypothetical protein
LEEADWRRFLIEELVVSPLRKRFATFYGTYRFSAVYSQEPATDPCPQPDDSNPHPPTLFFKICFSIILTLLSQGVSSSGLLNKIQNVFLIPPICAIFPVQLIILDLVTLFGDGAQFTEQLATLR